ncbi:MAG: aminopeptidase P family protein [Anaerolineales bacterium]|nr:aminopeptidase P family protein [Anaerolineales bacterium]
MAQLHSVENLNKRQAKALALLAERGLDALAVNATPSQFYLAGSHFHLMERPTLLFLTPGRKPLFVLPGFEVGKTHNLGYPLDTVPFGEDPALWQASFDLAASQLGAPKRIGIENLHLRVMELRYLERAFPDASFEDAGDLIAELRMTKDESEQAAMQAAVVIAEAALEATLAKLRVGMTEIQIAGELIQQLYAYGSDPELPFQPIVASGPNSANPHATVSERALQAGDLLLFDWGASKDGYFSDLTRTVAVGEVEPEFKKIYETVRLANAAAREAAQPGAACGDVDAAAREVIEDSGYGAQFTHRTGHGLGIEAHEEPYMRAGNPMVLEPGMTFTVEPGIYLDGRGGVRIEDNVVITEDGHKSFSSFPRELRVIG